MDDVRPLYHNTSALPISQASIVDIPIVALISDLMTAFVLDPLSPVLSLHSARELHGPICMDPEL